MLYVIGSIYQALSYLIIFVITLVIVLMTVRLIMNAVDVNPFTKLAIAVRRMSDPLINPARRALLKFAVQPKYAPFIVILLAILLGWLATKLTASVLNTVMGVMIAVKAGAFPAAIGYVIYGLLSLYTMLIFIRIICSWISVGYANRFVRFVYEVTDPLLVPLQRMVPRAGRFDISAIVAVIIIWVLQAAVAGTLLRNLPLQPFG
jgi:YggT family protein